MTAGTLDRPTEANLHVASAVQSRLMSDHANGLGDTLSGGEFASRTSADPAVRRALIVLSALATLYAFYVAKSVLLPISFAMILAIAVRPLAMKLRLNGIPLWLSAAASSCGLLAALLLLLSPIVSQIQSLELTEPAVVAGHFETIRDRLRPLKEGMADFQQAATQLEDEMANGDGSTEDAPTVVVEQQRPLTYAFGTSTAVISQLVVVVVGLFFFVLNGSTVVDRLITLSPRIAEKQRTRNLIRKLEVGISTYLVTVSMVNVGLGVVVGIAMALWGMPGAIVIGFLACLLNFVPILGALAGMVVVAAVAVMTFPPLLWPYWIGVPATYLALTSLEANVITPNLLGRSMSLSPLAVFVAIVFWGWMWGVGGIVIAVPALAIFAILCQHFPSTRVFAQLVRHDDSSE